ncbi:MBL fold metallo-hydrolase [Agrococcus sp. Marseille-P2731]|uniref:MBL fold metallo-hydrolase n=1 Tax=Agrococcus sp. Marseille-P2731 TaxID=1841862 RepID=UPI0009319499|nr:MBL fold metallo-hydrolase [Agrococcus sp. Marseille-P2731]
MTAQQAHVVTLGTAGGPRWWDPVDGGNRAGIATAVVVGGRAYLVDAGIGAGRQLQRAGIAMDDLGGIFLTHLHSDHTTDLANIALFGMFSRDPQLGRIPIVGPGDRGELPPVSPRATIAPQPVAPHLPTPGTADMFRLLMEAHATDLNDRVLDALRPAPRDLFDARDIAIPGGIGYHPNTCATPAMAPFTVFEDDRVRVDATLVEHPPIAPAFGFRITSDEGSIAISGDTARTANMVRLAEGADLLLHEAIDFDWVDAQYGDTSDATARASRDHHRKSHTSVLEAAAIAREADVGQLLLHHLVPGSTALARWQALAAELDPAPVITQDLARYTFTRQRQLAV